MRIVATTFVLAGLMMVPLGAQSRGGWYGSTARGIPPGQMPPPGLCRVWYDNRPPGRQPAATNCRDAERKAARDRRARVIYGPPAASPYPSRQPYPYPGDSRYPYPYPGDSRYPYPSPYPNDSRYPYPNSSPYPGANRGPYANRSPAYPYANQAWNQGYRDGYDKGREDARDRDSYDPVRHSRYRSADRGYERRYGSKDQYKLVYRDGFEAGYDVAYREWARGRR